MEEKEEKSSDEPIFEERCIPERDGTLGYKKILPTANGIKRIYGVPFDVFSGAKLDSNLVTCVSCNRVFNESSTIYVDKQFVCIECFAENEVELTREQYEVLRCIYMGRTNSRDIADIVGIRINDVRNCKDYLVRHELVIRGVGLFPHYRLSNYGKEILQAYSTVYLW